MVMSPVFKHKEQLGITLRAVHVLPPSNETSKGPLLDPMGVIMNGDVAIVRGLLGSTARKGSVLLKASSLMLFGMASTTTTWATAEPAKLLTSAINHVKNKRLRSRNFIGPPSMNMLRSGPWAHVKTHLAVLSRR